MVVSVEFKKAEGNNPEGLTEQAEQLCLSLFDIGAVKFGNFRLKLHEKHPEAPLAPDYIDLRLLQRFPKVKLIAVDIYQELVRPLKFDLLAVVPWAASPLISSLSDRIGVGMITPRIDEKSHGSGRKIDGFVDLDKGKTALIADDLISMADSKLEAFDVLSNQGLVVKDVVVLIDRQQGGKERLVEKRLNLHAAMTRDQLLDFYLRTGKISQAVYQDTKNRLTALNSFFAS